MQMNFLLTNYLLKYKISFETKETANSAELPCYAYFNTKFRFKNISGLSMYVISSINFPLFHRRPSKEHTKTL